MKRWLIALHSIKKGIQRKKTKIFGYICSIVKKTVTVNERDGQNKFFHRINPTVVILICKNS